MWWASSGNGTSGAPAESALGDQSQPSAVHLVTAELDPMRAYYVDVLGFGVLDQTDARVSLGHEGTEILTLTEDPECATDSPDQAGLYHSAFLYEDEASLASALLRAAESAPNNFQGSSEEATSSPSIGHVHLRVGDLKQAQAFYADALGFTVTAEANGALFFAAGGYHHLDGPLVAQKVSSSQQLSSTRRAQS